MKWTDYWLDSLFTELTYSAMGELIGGGGVIHIFLWEDI